MDPHVARFLVWTFFAVHSGLCVVYCALSLVSFTNIRDVTRCSGPRCDNTAANGLLAACMMGFLIVLFYLIYSFIYFFQKPYEDVSLGYGTMLTVNTHTAAFVLLAGLVVNAFQNTAEALKGGAWSTLDYDAYVATYVIAYILVGTFIIFWGLLVFKRNEMFMYLHGSTSSIMPVSK